MTNDARTALKTAVRQHPELAQALMDAVDPPEVNPAKQRVRRTPSGAKYLGHRSQ